MYVQTYFTIANINALNKQFLVGLCIVKIKKKALPQYKLLLR